MYTRFEEFAAGSMMGTEASPPRLQGKLHFQREWERNLFGMAIALSKAGVFEWEAFRQQLIASIAEWEQCETCIGQPAWDYYECFLTALERVLAEQGLAIEDGTIGEETAAATSKAG